MRKQIAIAGRLIFQGVSKARPVGRHQHEIVLAAKVQPRGPEEHDTHHQDRFLMTTVYKIVTRDLWQAAEASGVFAGAGIDLNDGFIHLSTGAQARRTARLYFGGQDNLVLVAADGTRLGDALKYEPSCDGDLFPHLYGPLPLAAVLWVRSLPLGKDGNHIFPDEGPSLRSG
jgi:uncharacterized protein (DUF952 family)